MVRRRHDASVFALARSLDYCKQATVFDNTHDFTCLALWSYGTLAWWGVKPAQGSWLADAMKNDTIWKR